MKSICKNYMVCNRILCPHKVIHKHNGSCNLLCEYYHCDCVSITEIRKKKLKRIKNDCNI